MKYKTKSVCLNPQTTDKYKTRGVYLDKTYSNTGGIGEGLAYAVGNVGIGAAGIVEGVTDLVSAAGCGISSAAEKTGDVGLYMLTFCDGEFCDDLFLYFKKYIE